MFTLINSLDVYTTLILCIACIIACLIAIFKNNLKSYKYEIRLMWMTIGSMVLVAIYKIAYTFFPTNGVFYNISGKAILVYIFFFLLYLVVGGFIKCKKENLPAEKRKVVYSTGIILLILMIVCAIYSIKNGVFD